MRIGGGNFEFVVKIGGQEVTEFNHASRGTFVECNLAHGTTYKISEPEGGSSGEAGMWPVTPYTLQLSNHYPHTDIYATVEVDGRPVATCIIKSASSKTIIGFEDGDSIKELLFSFPAVTSTSHDDVSQNVLAHLGEIKVVVRRATFKNFNVGHRGRGASSRRCVLFKPQFCSLGS